MNRTASLPPEPVSVASSRSVGQPGHHGSWTPGGEKWKLPVPFRPGLKSPRMLLLPLSDWSVTGPPDSWGGEIDSAL